MYSTLSEYTQDIDKVLSLLELTSALKEFSGHCGTGSQEDQSDAYSAIAHKLHGLSQNNNANLLVLNGTLLLFMAGRFEIFVRATFEELCINTSVKADKFSHLPKEMRENLISYTAEVIANPRRYGHGDNGVKGFVRVLSENLSDAGKLNDINVACISITSENMRPAILNDLFKRIGISNIWEKVSQQAKLQTFFHTHDSGNAKKESEKFLNELMNERNKIAHPSSSFTWPDHDYVKQAGEFLKTFGIVLIDSIEAIEFDLQSRIENNKKNTANQNA